MSDQIATLSNAGRRPLMTTRVRTLAIIGLTLATIVAMALAPRIPQEESYHDFADQRSVLGISNFLNVVSNLPFLLTGVAGLLFVTRKPSTASTGSFLHRFERWPYAVFFLGVTLACFGSAYWSHPYVTHSPKRSRFWTRRFFLWVGLSAVMRSSTSWQRSRFIGYSKCSSTDCMSRTL